MNNISIENVLSIALKAYEKSIVENYSNKEEILEIICALKILSNPLINKKEYSRQRIKNKNELYKVTYYLSRFGHEKLMPLNQTRTFKKVGEILGIKATTIKATRDRFDPFFDNGRIGVGKKHLTDEMQRVFDDYQKLQEDEILQDIKNILKLI